MVAIACSAESAEPRSHIGWHLPRLWAPQQSAPVPAPVATAMTAAAPTTLKSGSRLVALRQELEGALKESVRDLERAAQRHAKGANVIDAEYLKNTVFKMFLTGEAEALLPVFATILSFSPEEVRRCKDGLAAIKRGEVPMAGAAAAVDASLSAITSISTWTSWLGGGGGGGGSAASARPPGPQALPR
ncbi:Protein GRIP [Tetrabaena socialis]|uniref:Protein GRIP n=1 Tax=Tetrabaena socialis TaxID=47790 RepID=A0A2J8AHJ2_9CHLO|nr:Protein GRIP [Tetrabaena socialis]|eukprot:PNH11993.1 Protein GRIP [Tetrabaena socialis]